MANNTTSAAVGQRNPFFKTTYGELGHGWTVTNGKPIAQADLPSPQELANREVKLRSTLKQISVDAVRDARTDVLSKSGTTLNSGGPKLANVKTAAHILPQAFPVQAGEFDYVPQEQNPLYTTSANVNGAKKPAPHELPDRFFPRAGMFSGQFTGGGKQRDTRLSTGITRSKVHSALDHPY